MKHHLTLFFLGLLVSLAACALYGYGWQKGYEYQTPCRPTATKEPQR